MRIDIFKLRTSDITTLVKELNAVDKELEADTAMNPLSYARYKDLCDYKTELLREVDRRKKG